MLFNCSQLPWRPCSYVDHIIEDKMTFDYVDEPVVVVPVPRGKNPGETIAVQNPQEGGGLVYASIPNGKKPGDSFLVRIPCPRRTIFRDKNGVQYAQSSERESPKKVPALLMSEENSIREELIDPEAPVSNPQSSPGNESMILVNVPRGAAPGSILNVPVPGENRFIAAKVPPGTSQFYVSYEPDDSPPSTPERKFVDVSVPPNTAPGTTIHIEAPDEPGRVLSAKVPYDAREFSVAYKPWQNKIVQSHDSQQLSRMKYFPNNMFCRTRSRGRSRQYRERSSQERSGRASPPQAFFRGDQGWADWRGWPDVCAPAGELEHDDYSPVDSSDEEFYRRRRTENANAKSHRREKRVGPYGGRLAEQGDGEFYADGRRANANVNLGDLTRDVGMKNGKSGKGDDGSLFIYL